MLKVGTAIKKPLPIRFIVLSEDNLHEVAQWVTEAGEHAFVDGKTLQLQTIEGLEPTPPGYVIIQGIRGEFYPCDPDIFYESYNITVEA